MGIIYSNDFLQRRVALQVVGRRTDISLLGEWKESIPTSKTVTIGKTGEVEAEKLKEKSECTIYMIFV
jgi:hypothetical protein